MTWFVDAHVHYHQCFGWQRFLGGAFDHLDRLAGSQHADPGIAGCLCFVDLHGEHTLSRWIDARPGADRGAELLPPQWRITPTLEPTAWRLERPEGAPLVLIAGRQITTEESLEVLALSCSAEIAEGRPLQETLDAALDAAAVTVIPWGFGKWWFGRGRSVASALATERGGRIQLGDNGNRLALGPTPPLFEAAARRGIAILPGSDPLPFVHHATRALGYGFRLEGDLDLQRPGASLRRGIAALDGSPPPVGGLTSLPRFAVDQVRMQWRVRQRRHRERADEVRAAR